ncbi:hypothetical protein LTR85_006863 [Meristemomyces frigidus]|nr:hypothetical protein LTR85_006863 [Meristemomyces frigidus]
MATGSDIRAALASDFTPTVDPLRAAPTPTAARATPNQPRTRQPRLHKKPALRNRGRAAHWTYDTSTPPTRRDRLQVRQWRRAAPSADSTDVEPPASKFAKYDVKAEAPSYDDETYAQHLNHPDWTKEETDLLFAAYEECNGKWPVVVDHYETSTHRSMEELKSRLYSISATLLNLQTPMTAMTASEYSTYEVLKSFDPLKEASRKKLAEGHLRRPRNEVDEETVLLSELQRIMLHQQTLDSEREDLRRRLQHPVADQNGYQYSTSQALTTLWQQLLAADRAKKTQRLRPLEISGSRPSQSAASIADATSATPQTAQAVDMSKQDLLRFGVVQAQEKLPTGISFASDKLSKPRVAKSSLQTDKIAATLAHIGVPELIPLPTPAVVEQFERIMAKMQTLLDLRKVAEKEEQELRVRSAELGV